MFAVVAAEKGVGDAHLAAEILKGVLKSELGAQLLQRRGALLLRPHDGLGPGRRAEERQQRLHHAIVAAARANAKGRPIWVLHGSLDTLCTAEDAKAIAQAAPRGSFVEFANAGHFDLPWSDPGLWESVLRQATADGA